MNPAARFVSLSQAALQTTAASHRPLQPSKRLQWAQADLLASVLAASPSKMPRPARCPGCGGVGPLLLPCKGLLRACIRPSPRHHAHGDVEDLTAPHNFSMASQIVSRAASAAATTSFQTLTSLGVGPTARAIATSGRGPAVAAAAAAATVLGASFGSSALAKSPPAITVSICPETAAARRDGGARVGPSPVPESSKPHPPHYVALSLAARAISGPYGVFMQLEGRSGAATCLAFRCAARIRSASCGCGRVRCVSHSPRPPSVQRPPRPRPTAYTLPHSPLPPRAWRGASAPTAAA